MWPRAKLGRTTLLCGSMLALGIGIGANFSAATAAEPERAPSGYSRYQKLDMFARALSIIEQHYVRPVDDTQLVYAAIQGLVSELDPHTGFLPPREAKLLREDIEGAFGGVGMVVVLGREADGKRYLDVRDVIADGPAHKAGIRVGYHIVAIDGQAITQFPDLEQAIVTIRGRPGTKLSVTIKDPEREVLRAITLTREIIEPPAVEVRYMGEGLGLLRLREFAEDATQEVIDGLDTMAKEAGRLGLRGIVLDLRDNGGGLLGEAIGIADVFIEEGAIVRTRGRQGVVLDEARARRPGTHHDLPLVVLVNKGSASASEIVAGALQDHGRALLVGERTYGKGSVQAPFTLRDGSMLKLTTALYYTPSDRLIQASGVAPDVFVGASQEEGLPNLDSRPEIDPERIQPRHLRPEDFGRKTPSISDETPALQAAGDDLQLRTAVQHLYAWSRLRLTNRIKTGR